MEIQNILLLVLSLAMGLTGTLNSNAFAKRFPASAVDYHLYNMCCSLVSAVVLTIVLAMQGGVALPSAYTVAIALIYGTVTAVSSFFSMLALRYGSVSYTAVIGSSSMIIPALSGRVFWQEPVAPVQYLGILLMLVSFVLSIRNDPGDKGVSVKWLLFCSCAALGSGAIGILQKVHQNSPHAGELGLFLIIAFLMAAAVSGGRAMWSAHAVKRTDAAKEPPPRRPTWKRLCVMSLVSGLCGALCNQINLYLAGVLPSIFFFPVVNGVALLLSVSAGVVVLRERFTRRQTAGICFGIVSVFLLCNIWG